MKLAFGARSKRRSPLVRQRFPLGLELGKETIKWVQLGKTAGKLTVVELGIQPLKSIVSAQGQPVASLRDALKQVVTQNRLAGDAVVSLPLEEVTLRILKLPALPESELEEAIRWQIEQILPQGVSYGDVTVDYLVLQEIAQTSESRVLVAFALRQRVTALMEHVRSAGLKPVAVDIDPFAFATSLRWQRRFRPDETVLLIHLGESTSSLSIVAGGQLAFSASILTTGRSLLQVVADILRLPREQAELLIQTHGLSRSPEVNRPEAPGSAEEGKTVAGALASPLENLIVDILRIFRTFSQQVTQSQLKRFDWVALAGEAAKVPDLAPWLQARVGVPVELVDPLSIFPIREDLASREPWAELAPHFAIAMGLALREVERKG